jgi:hypothetical protein
LLLVFTQVAARSWGRQDCSCVPSKSIAFGICKHTNEHHYTTGCWSVFCILEPVDKHYDCWIFGSLKNWWSSCFTAIWSHAINRIARELNISRDFGELKQIDSRNTTSLDLHCCQGQMSHPVLRASFRSFLEPLSLPSIVTNAFDSSSSFP